MKMGLRAFLLLAFAFALVFTASAHADVLFLDLNDNVREREAAARAAEARGESLIILSTVDEDHEVKVRESRKAYATASKAQGATCAKDPGAACRVARAEWTRTGLELRKTLAAVPKMNGAYLNSAMAQAKKSGVQVSSIIVSGHDGDRQFWGTYGDFDDNDLEKALLANRPVGDNIKSLYLWGCYSATTDDFVHGWKKAFPESLMVAGFSGQAPLGTRPASSQILEDLLVKEKNLREATDQKRMREIFDSLNGVNERNNPSLAVCLDHKTVISRVKGVRSVDDDIEACTRKSEEEDHWTGIYECYMRGKPGCETIPVVTDERSPLRHVYDYFQETKHCEEVLKGQGRTRAITALGVRRLLFDNVVRKNFEKLHHAELEKMNALLDELGLPPELRIRGLAGLSRKKYLDLLKGIKVHWDARMQALADEHGQVKDARVVAVGKYIEEVEKIEKGACVPLSWVEDDDQLKDSRCGIKAGMQSAMSRARDEITKLEGMPPPPPRRLGD